MLPDMYTIARLAGNHVLERHDFVNLQRGVDVPRHSLQAA
jgi:hypothetical protein